MRVTISGSGAILTHGDSLAGGGVIEFPINEPPEFDDTLAAYTVTGSAPSRKLRFQGHEIAVETPTGTAERAPDTGSGITNGADAGQIAVSDGTNLTGSADLTWDQVNHALGIDAEENGHAQIVTLGIGAELAVKAADGDATHVGGELSLQSGNSVGQDGGQILISTGNDSGGGNSGRILIQTNSAPDGRSGHIDIRPGAPSASAQGGSVNVVAGTGQTGSGGSVVIQAGPKITGGSHGTVQVYSANGTHFVELSETAGWQFFGGVIVLDGLPTADPHVVGQVWNSTGTLKVSAG
jgi:hypothetical protein